ncbi:MAG: hypothetical protein LBC81_04145 [Tannerellaceae bacterium]|jgi:hypothetical protein|nr:hypothetical protein [Tannerellaceae bacterium]
MDTREKKTKLKLSGFLLCMLISLTVSSCYGPELDIIQKEISDIKKDIEAIKAKIDNGKFIVSVVPIAGGFTISFSDGLSHTITSGANGQPGENGTIWHINIADSCWYYTPPSGVAIPTTMRAIPRDGKAGAAGQSAPAPKISPSGFWIMYEWNPARSVYDTIISTIPANLTPYLVYPPTNPHYVYMFVPKRDNSVPPRIVYDSIALPLEDKKVLIISFKGYGYKEGQTIKMLDSLAFKYWQIDASALPTWAGEKQITQDTLFTNWQSPVQKPDSLVVVFAANNPNATNLYLEDSQRDSNPFLTLTTPVRLTNELLTKAYYDTLYYARMQYVTNVPSGTKNGNVQYFLVNNSPDRERSIASYPINATTPYPIPAARVTSVGGAMPLATTDARYPYFNIDPASTALALTFSGGEYMYDYLIRDTAVIAAPLIATSANKKTFTFKKTPTTIVPSITYKIVVEKLMKNGSVVIDTLAIRTDPSLPLP